VTHDVREALLLATRIVLLKNGMIDVMASPSDFRNARTSEALAFLASLNHGDGAPLNPAELPSSPVGQPE